MDTNRLKLGIVFNFNPSWMGGIIYILNLIRTLNFLDDDEKPEIVLFYRADLKKFAEQIKYPHFKAVEWHFPNVYSGYIKSWLSGKNEFIEKIIRQYALDGLYPVHDFPVRTKGHTKVVCWYADLQHKHYPRFFRKRKLFERSMRIRFIIKNCNSLVLSSQAVKDDFRKFFRLDEKMNVHIFHFVSVIDDLEGLDIDIVREKYKLPAKYFMISNQFHKHKNHKVLLEALALLKQRDSKVHLAITGRFRDSTHSPYMKELHEIIDRHNLHSQISLLGIIPRNEQLLLMKHSQAVLQPSLFEGWSTVIEDAISLQVPVVASDLSVNIEQLGEKGTYFNPHNAEELASILHSFPERNSNVQLYDDYETRVRSAARDFIRIFS